jgi:hypothetical protein
MIWSIMWERNGLRLQCQECCEGEVNESGTPMDAEKSKARNFRLSQALA